MASQPSMAATPNTPNTPQSVTPSVNPPPSVEQMAQQIDQLTHAVAHTIPSSKSAPPGLAVPTSQPLQHNPAWLHQQPRGVSPQNPLLPDVATLQKELQSQLPRMPIIDITNTPIERLDWCVSLRAYLEYVSTVPPGQLVMYVRRLCGTKVQSYMDSQLARMPLLRTDFLAFMRALEAFLLEPDLGSRVLEDLLEGHRPYAHRDVYAYVHGVDHAVHDARATYMQSLHFAYIKGSDNVAADVCSRPLDGVTAPDTCAHVDTCWLHDDTILALSTVTSAWQFCHPSGNWSQALTDALEEDPLVRAVRRN
ncbi:hypothetical protein PPROV_000673900 [Pycnococcus provasolii]|uniref:Uncharacterized protein n=1 Tax=Pycnococcus provasolii TaxID=41880 RepID=A0A830HSS2_9CHLO|nr:hypothetical protein PPROV_000673900 [Pycnococcus provasolii]